MNPAKYLKPYAAGIAAFFRQLGPSAALRRQNKTTVVICPTTKMPAEVGLDSDLHMESCSHWPELEGCTQSCTPQVQFSAEDLQDFAARYEGKNCSSCGRPLTRDDWYKSRLAVLETDAGARKPVETVRPLLPIIPATSDPICSSCYGAQVA